jgi:hypothetical protein
MGFTLEMHSLRGKRCKNLGQIETSIRRRGEVWRELCVDLRKLRERERRSLG